MASRSKRQQVKRERTDADWRELYRRARMSAYDKGFGYMADDLAQAVMLKYASGRGSHQLVEHATLDEIRREFGDPRRKSHEARAHLESALSLSLDENLQHVEDSAPAPLPTMEALLEGIGDERVRFIVAEVSRGATYREIAKELGVSESYVCNLYHGAIRRLKRIEKGLYEKSHIRFRDEIRKRPEKRGSVQVQPSSLDDANVHGVEGTWDFWRQALDIRDDK